VEYIWRAKTSVPKVLFLLVRYIMPLIIFMSSFQQSYRNTSFPDTFCKVWFNVATGLFVVMFAIENFLILLRVWILNDRKRNVVKWTGLFYIVMQIVSVGYAIAVMVTATEHFHFVLASDDPDHKTNTRLCSIDHRSILPGTYIPSITFEAVMILLILWGTHIRSRNMENKSLMSYLLNDGFIYILLLFFVRITNMLITTTAPAALIFSSICFGCATSATTVSRLLLGLRRDSVNRRRIEEMSEGRSLIGPVLHGNYGKPICAHGIPSCSCTSIRSVEKGETAS